MTAQSLEAVVRPDDFVHYFEQLHGDRSPYPWQRALAETLIQTGRWPDAIVAPTGSGKSSVVDVHLFAVAVTHAPGWTGPRVPRRLWHVVGRRALVDDMVEHAEHLLAVLTDALEGGRDDAVGAVARSLAALSPDGATPGAVWTLRGGLAPERGWQDDPVSCQVICATPDMAGSRLLFRGYGSTVGMRPREAGLLAYDSALIVDEAHLNRQLLTTARRVAELAGESPLADQVPVLQVVETTATPASDAEDQRRSLGVSLEDIRTRAVGEELSRRLDRPKPITLHCEGPWLTEGTSKQLMEGARAVVAMAAAAHDAGQRPVGIVLNRVASASAVHQVLAQERPDLTSVLLVGPRRRWEQARDRAMEQPDVYVATQAIEVGVDLDFGCLITDLAAGSAVAQRAGRLNRTGVRDQAPVHVLCPPEGKATPGSALPYTPEDLVSSLAWLKGRADDPKGLAPSAVLADPPPVATSSRPIFSEIEPARAALFSRTSEPLLIEPDLTLWLRDELDQEVDVAVVGRRLPRVAEAGEYGSDAIDADGTSAMLAAAPPQPHEVYPSTVGRLLGVLFPRRGNATPAFIRRGRTWVQADATEPERRIRPGDTVVVPHDWAAARQHVLTTGGPDEVGDVLDPRGETGDMLSLEAVKARSRWTALVTGSDAPGVSDALRRSFLEVCADVWETEDEPGLDAVRSALVDRGQWEFWQGYLGPWGEPDPTGGRRVDVTVGARSPGTPSQASWAALHLVDAADPDDAYLSATTAGRWVLLVDHQRDVGERAASFGRALRLTDELVETLARAGRHHDDGKADSRFQVFLAQAAEEAPGALAKSGVARLPLAQRWFLPDGWRHEQLSAAMLWATGGPADELAVRLVGTSHGLGRGLFPMAAQRLLERSADDALRAAAAELFDEGVWDALVLRTEARWGLWGVAWLEAVLRAADVTISKEGR